MYKCKDCETVFDEPTYIKDDEVIDYGIGSRWVTLFEGEVCPYCESHNFEEEDLNDEDDDVTESDETVGVRLQQGTTTADDGA